ncbi:MAG TPA: hypothetical protein VHA09_05815 [Nitrososphaera sp.]|nr:hypothetical protein [Nitrososphaera sp.]
MAEHNKVVSLLLYAAAAVFIAAALTIPKTATNAAYAQAMSIEVNAPILKVKPGESAVKDITVYGTGVDSMQVTDVTFGEGREIFRLGNPLPVQATHDPVTGKLKVDVPLIVTLPPQTLKDSEYPFTVTATSGQQSVQANSRALVVVVTSENPAGYLPDSAITALYVVMAVGGVFCIILYKKVAARRS